MREHWKVKQSFMVVKNDVSKITRIRRVANPGNGADIQPYIITAINEADNGDEIFLPEGDFILLNKVTVEKRISIRGAGIGKTIIKRAESSTDTELATWEEMFLFDPQINYDTSHIAVTGITFKSKIPSISDGTDGKSMAADKCLNFNKCIDFRVSECRFEYFGHSAIYVLHHYDVSRGLIHKNQFYHNVKSINGTGGVMGLGLGYSVSVFGENTQWTEEPNFGSGNFIFIEDNIFDIGRHAVAAGGCGRYVARYNTITNFHIAQALDAHEAQGSGGGLNFYATRAVEIYNNTIINTTFKDGTPIVPGRPAQDLSNNAILIRGGEALIHNNTISGFRMGVGMIDFHTAAGVGGYPTVHSIGYRSGIALGSGHSGTGASEGDGDLFMWDNNITLYIDPSSPIAELYNYDNTKWVEGRDYHKSAKPNYTPYQYPHPHINASIRKNNLSQVNYPILSEMQAVFNAMTVQPSHVNKYRYNDVFRKNIMNSGVWTELDALWVFIVGSGQGSQAALINWKDPNQFTLIPSGFNFGDFSEKNGYTTNPSNSTYFRTQFTPSVNGVKYSLNSSSFGISLKNNIQDASNTAMGVWDGTNFAIIRPRSNSDAIAAYINETGGTFTSNNNSSGLNSIIRQGASTTKIYRGQTLLTTGSSTSTGLPTKEFYIGARNSNGLASLFISNTIELVYIGSGDVDHAAVENFKNELKVNLR
jgi:hypothetical protein